MALINEVKTQLGITIDDQDIDSNIQMKINAVMGYLIDGGAVIKEPIEAKTSACIAIGVNDLLNNKAGGTDFSPAFHILSRQICSGGE